MSNNNKQKVVHRDIASRNFLVSSESRILISDFGLSRLLAKNADSNDYEYASTQNSSFPVRTTSPEAIAKSRWTERSDVWSYGKIVLFCRCVFHFDVVQSIAMVFCFLA